MLTRVNNPHRRIPPYKRAGRIISMGATNLEIVTIGVLLISMLLAATNPGIDAFSLRHHTSVWPVSTAAGGGIAMRTRRRITRHGNHYCRIGKNTDEDRRKRRRPARPSYQTLSALSRRSEEDTASDSSSSTDVQGLHSPSPPTAAAAPAAASTVPSYRQLLVFCGTTILIWLSEPLLSLVDTTVVGWTCPAATATVQLAALGPATTLIDSLLYLTYFLSIATTTRIAAELAQAQAQTTTSSEGYRQLQRTTSHVLSVAIALGAIVTVTAMIGAPVFLQHMLGASSSSALLQYATRYTRIRAMAALAAVTGMTMQSFCLAVLDTRTPALAVLVAACTNTVGDVLLTPRWGVAGAAVATAFSSCVSAAILARAVRRTMTQWRCRQVQLWESEQQQQQQSMVAIESTDSAPVVSNSTSPGWEQPEQEHTLQASIHKVASLKDDNAIPQINKNINSKNDMNIGLLPPHPIALLSLPDRKSALELISLAGPIFYVILAKVACYGAMTVRCTAFGVPAMAAHSIMMRIFFFFSTFGDSLSQTAQSFLPATIYPSLTASGGGDDDRAGFAKILRRLFVVAAVLAVTNSNIAVQVLQVGGKFLTRDPVIVGLMRQHTGFLGASILLHPFIMLLEGTVIASRKFRSLVIIYTGTLAWQLAALMFLTGSFPAIWRTFFLFQLTRLGLYTFRVVRWRQVQRQNSNNIEKVIAVGS